MAEPLLKMSRAELVAGLSPVAVVIAAAVVMTGRFGALGSVDDGRLMIGWMPGWLAAMLLLATRPSAWSLVAIVGGAVTSSLLYAAGWHLTAGAHPPAERLLHGEVWLLISYACGVSVPLFMLALPTARRARARAELKAREAAAARTPPCPPEALVRGATVAGLLTAALLAGLLFLGDRLVERWFPTQPIRYSAASGDQVALGRAIRRGEDVNAADDLGSTPLLRAAMSGQTACVEMLLRAGADPNVREHIGATPLQWAAAGGDAAMCRALLKAGADPLARGARDQTPLDWARERGDPEILAVFGLTGAGSESGGSRSRDAAPLTRGPADMGRGAGAAGDQP